MTKRLKKRRGTQGQNIKPPHPESGYDNLGHPVFCFRHLHRRFNLRKIDDREKSKLISKLHDYSKMSWHDITHSPRHGRGSEKISQSSIKAGIPPHVTPDVQFHALRYFDNKPIVGYRTGVIFHIVYIDYNRTLYDHGR